MVSFGDILSRLNITSIDSDIKAQCARLLEICWEQLYLVHYLQVSKEWRVAYTLACFMMALIEESPQGSIGYLDKAIIMAGAPILGSEIQVFISDCASHLNPITVISVNLNDLGTKFKEPAVLCPVRRISATELYIQDFKYLSEPVIITGAIDHWLAVSSRPWNNLEYLYSHISPARLVPVEIGSKYTDDNWSQKLMRFEDFVNDYLLSNNGSIGYLAQHNLFNQVPSLLDDISAPEYCTISQMKPVLNIWLGPPGTVSPAHTDPHDNLFAQVVGSKYFRMFSPDESTKLYSHTGIMSNTSGVKDVENLDLNKFPLMQGIVYQDCVISAGELLFIPKGWWHHVRSLSVSLSVSFWY